MNCRFCSAPLTHIFLDLGSAPPSNNYLTEEDLNRPEIYYPLKLFVCEKCWLVQTEDYASASDLFSPNYAYFSSTSTSWLNHAKRYATMIVERLHLGPKSFVVEVAANDGYLLTNFVDAKIPCLGIEPTASTASIAQSKNIPILQAFFDVQVASALISSHSRANLIIANNVYAHVPDVCGFTGALRMLLAPGGTITLEFPHLMRLIAGVQFDTVYHEHFSYFSLWTVARIFESAGLRVYDVEELHTHGGSLRVYGCHSDFWLPESDAVTKLLAIESAAGLRTLAPYEQFQPRADYVRREFTSYLLKQKLLGTRIGGYGAAAKGNTLLNYAGIRSDLLPYVCDAASSKQGKYLPGSRIPIVTPDEMVARRPEVVLVLPWNISEEVRLQYADLGAKFVTAVPAMREL